MLFEHCPFALIFCIFLVRGQMSIEVWDIHGAHVIFNAYYRMGYSHTETGASSTWFLQQTDLCKMAFEQIEGSSLNWQKGWLFTPKISDTLNNTDSVDMFASIHTILHLCLPMITRHTLALMQKHNQDLSRWFPLGILYSSFPISLLYLWFHRCNIMVVGFISTFLLLLKELICTVHTLELSESVSENIASYCI